MGNPQSTMSKSVSCATEELSQRFLVARLGWRHDPAEQVAVTRERRLLTFDLQLPFELVSAKRNLQAPDAAHRDPLVGGQQRAARTDVHNPHSDAAREPELVLAVERHARGPSSLL